MQRCMALVLIAGMLLCAGCTATKYLPVEPQGPDDTLLIGRVQMEINGLPKELPLSIANGVYKQNIALTFENVESDETTIILSQANGVFFKRGLLPGTYRLSKLMAAFQKTNSTTTITIPIDDDSFAFQIEQGKVTNMGGFACLFAGFRIAYAVRETPEIFKAKLTASFRQSAWLSREWLEVNLDFTDAEQGDVLHASWPGLTPPPVKL